MIAEPTTLENRFLQWEELDFANPQFRYLFSVMPNATAAFDENICYLAVSDEWCKSYRLSQADLIGKCHYDIFPEIPERWKILHQRALQGEAISNKKDPFVRENGDIDWVDWELAPMIDKLNNVRGFILFTEVTPQEIPKG